MICGARELLDGSHTQASSSRKTTGSGLITAIKLSSLCVLYDDDDEGECTTVSILVSVSQAAKDIKALVASLRLYMPNRRKVISSPLVDYAGLGLVGCPKRKSYLPTRLVSSLVRNWNG